MAGKERTQVVIHGRAYNLSGGDAERTRTLARTVNAAMARLSDALPQAEDYQLAILAALHIADESLRFRTELEAFRSGVDASASRMLEAIEAGMREGLPREEPGGPKGSLPGAAGTPPPG